ncbi:MAG: MG2 domain-containing protein, partial [Betaproteobacteria bacterium]
IDEEQHFILRLNGPATPESIQASVWCGMRGIGERIAVRLIDGEDRLAMLRSRRMERQAQAAPLQFVTLACNRRLTPSADVQLVFGKGVTTPSVAGASGIANAVERRFDFQVREPFAADFQCERENARSACLPIRPLSLHFNAPVARALAEGIRLSGGSKRFAPVFDQGAGATADGWVDDVRFQTVLPENTAFLLELPAGFKDDAGRALRNGASFPLKVSTGPMPPLAKFAAAPFGIVERLAEPDGVALLPVTLRNVEAALPTRDLRVAPPDGLSGSKVSDLKPTSDAQIIAWYRKLQRYDEYRVPRDLAAKDVRGPLPAPLDVHDRDDVHDVQTRLVSLLQGQPGVLTRDLPRPVRNDPRPFEVVGIPLSPGFHVVEIASPMLGASLLDPRYGSDRTMFVRTSALVTNLGVHFKLGSENALAWVTALDSGRPVAQARVKVSDCKGRELASAVTDANGLARFTGIAAQAPVCDEYGAYVQAYFVSARADIGRPGHNALAEDLAFTWSDWHKGIEPWRFNLPTSQQVAPDNRAHTIFDRTLLRAGETVSMKHILRSETLHGLELPTNRPDKLVVTHVGSGQQYQQPLAWRKTATGGLSAESVFVIPVAAKLGVYEVSLAGAGEGSTWPSGQFRVEAFRLPVLKGSILPTNRDALIQLQKLPVDVQIQYVSGGGASGLPVQVSALVRNKVLRFDGFDDFSFTPPRSRTDAAPGTEEDEEQNAGADARVVADKLPLVLDRNGAGRVMVDGLPMLKRPQELLLEASYADPGGEVQTLRSSHTLWPAAVVPGIKTEDWVSVGQDLRFQALALDLGGKVLADVPLQVRAVARVVTTSRKRIVGGFYAYDNRTEIKELGPLCSGRSDVRGLLVCKTTLTEPGEVELVVTATDRQGRKTQAASSVYVTRHGEVWFGGENHDRMDVLPEKKSYEPGETAKLQVRMPFRFATALVAVEREGVIETQVLQLRGEDPTITLKIKPQWAPNVYVSVLSVRGRLREVPWYSFFTWGYKVPREWWTSFWYGGREYVAPTAMVDLSKPAFRLGVAEIRVGNRAHKLDVSVKADQPVYPVRGKAQVTIQVKLPNGRPAANAEVALAAVDEALLELMPNTSWDLLDAMLQRRAWGVDTSTAQMEIIGRRHYGRKAVAPGGGGGHSATRELFDTLLLWNPRVQLD